MCPAKQSVLLFNFLDLLIENKLRIRSSFFLEPNGRSILLKPIFESFCFKTSTAPSSLGVTDFFIINFCANSSK